MKLLNLGCGKTYNDSWVNVDFVSTGPGVLAHNLLQGIPFPDSSFDVVYHSHVLEHFDAVGARNLVSECFRVLKSDGVIRLAVPNLEILAREYLQVLDAVASGDSAREIDYDWVMLELYDQVARTKPGGEMACFIAALAEENREFVRCRAGAEAENFWMPKRDLHGINRLKFLLNKFLGVISLKRIRQKIAGWIIYLIAGKATFKSFKMGIFRSSGEIHQWMYDRYSLKRLLENAGFVDVKICSANESCIPEFENYQLDVVNNKVRKPDSIYVEAYKP
jgi:predicted SAM-dependent methyltransferase